MTAFDPRHAPRPGTLPGSRRIVARQGQPCAGVSHVTSSRVEVRMRPFTTLMIESNGAIARVTLNRPDRRNAFDGQMATELREAFEDLAHDPSIRGIVLAATGSVFCAGSRPVGCSPTGRRWKPRRCVTPITCCAKFRADDEFPLSGHRTGAGIGVRRRSGSWQSATLWWRRKRLPFALSEPRLGLIPAVIAPFSCKSGRNRFSGGTASPANVLRIDGPAIQPGPATSSHRAIWMTVSLVERRALAAGALCHQGK